MIISLMPQIKKANTTPKNNPMMNFNTPKSNTNALIMSTHL